VRGVFADRLALARARDLSMKHDSGVDEQRWIILFDTIHHVIAAEEVFKENDVWCDLTPVPRDLSSDCGMAVEFRRRDTEAVRRILADPRVRPRSVHRPCSKGHADVTTTLL
jgi:hypothetical protein